MFKTVEKVNYISNLSSVNSKKLIIHVDSINKEFFEKIIELSEDHCILLIVEPIIALSLLEIISSDICGFILKDELFSENLDINKILEYYNYENIYLSPYFRDTFTLSYAKEEMSLTKREVEIVRLMSKGFTNIEIAHILFLSYGTIRNHVSNIFGKLNVGNRTEVVIKYYDTLKKKIDI